MSSMNIHYSSKHHGWETPKSVVDDLKAVFDFNLDVCAEASLIVFVKGRMRFEIDGVGSDSAPFPCAFVVFGSVTQLQQSKLSEYGFAVKGAKHG